MNVLFCEGHNRNNKCDNYQKYSDGSQNKCRDLKPFLVSVLNTFSFNLNIIFEFHVACFEKWKNTVTFVVFGAKDTFVVFATDWPRVIAVPALKIS